MRKNIFAVDVDGTLIQSGTTQLGDENLDAIKTILNYGDIFCFSSGRTFRSLKNLLKGNDLDVIYICENGNLIRNNDEILFVNVIEKELVLNIIDYLYKNHGERIGILVSLVDECLYYENKKLDIDFKPTSYQNLEYQDFLNIFKDKDVIKISIYMNELCDEFYQIYKDLNELFKGKIEVFDANNKWIDISKTGGNKGNGVKFIIEKFNLSYDNLYCFGDGENDLSMLKLTKNSFSPFIALDKVKEEVSFLYSSFPKLIHAFYLDKK